MQIKWYTVALTPSELGVTDGRLNDLLSEVHAALIASTGIYSADITTTDSTVSILLGVWVEEDSPPDSANTYGREVVNEAFLSAGVVLREVDKVLTPEWLKDTSDSADSFLTSLPKSSQPAWFREYNEAREKAEAASTVPRTLTTEAEMKALKANSVVILPSGAAAQLQNRKGVLSWWRAGLFSPGCGPDVILQDGPVLLVHEAP